MLIVDDTPTNVAVVSGVLKDSFKTKVATNGEKALAIAVGRGEAGPDPARRDDARHGRLRGLPPAQGQSRDPRHSGDLPHRQDRRDRRGERLRGRRRRLHPQAVLGADRARARARPSSRCRRRSIEAHEARNQADQLLHALLPKKAADEIRSIGTVIPRRYENVAVLFCDVTNFTAYCDKHEPEDVVSRLDALFVIFERVDRASTGWRRSRPSATASWRRPGCCSKSTIRSARRCAAAWRWRRP